MKKLVFSLLFFCFSTLASTPNVVLLSSIDTPKIWYHSSKWEIEQTLDKIFKNRFKDSGYNVVIREKVDQAMLKDELSNPNNIAIFWVSHSRGSTQVTGGVSSQAAIVDYYGKDVKDLFKDIHPNLRYLGMVGCNAKGMMDKYKKEGFYKNSPSLQIHAYDKKVDARIGLRKSIKRSVPQIGTIDKRFLSYPKIYTTDLVKDSFNQNQSCKIKSQGYKVEVRRIAKEDSPSVSIKIGDRVLALLPSLKKDQEYTTDFYISKPAKNSKSAFKISIDSNVFYSPEKLYLGEFEFTSSWEGTWSAFARRDGEPLGVTKNLYRYKGNFPENDHISSFQQYQCSL